MAFIPPEQTVRSWRTLLLIAVCPLSVALNSGCSLIGYDDTAAADASHAPEEAGVDSDGGLPDDASDSSSLDASDSSTDSDASDSSADSDASDSSWLDASDSSTDSDASSDAANDGSALDASDGSPDAAGDAGLDAAELDGSAEGGPDSSLDAATPTCDGMVCPPRCNLTGTYALKLTVPTTWPSTSQITSGSGTFEFRFRMRAIHVDNAATIQLQQCGQTVPVVTAQLVNEDSLFTFPNSLFDTEVLPSSSATMTLGDSTASSSLSLPPVAMELGVDLNDPLNDPWPSTAAGLSASQRVDVEGDGNPSITAVYSNASGHVYPRTSTSLFPQRAKEAYAAIRRVFSMTGMLTGCDGSQGNVSLLKLDSHILGCRHADGSLCSTSEANSLDTGLPKYQFGGGTYVLSRVADDASCPAVRAVP